MIKAVFFDIDGTLVPFGAPGIPKEVSDVIARMRRNGTKVFIATGRHPSWIDNLGDTEFDGYVAVNGGMCLFSDKSTCIFCSPIDQSDIRRLTCCDVVGRYPFAVVPRDGGIFLTGINRTVEDILDMLSIPPVPVCPIDEALHQEIVQLMMFSTEREREESGVMNDTLTHCVATAWHPDFCDIIPQCNDKSLGIDRMLEWFGIPLEEAMAFGDGGNDIGMLRHVGVGIAMVNASQDVKAAADYVTSDVTDHGVVNALTHFGLL